MASVSSYGEQISDFSKEKDGQMWVIKLFIACHQALTLIEMEYIRFFFFGSVPFCYKFAFNYLIFHYDISFFKNGSAVFFFLLLYVVCLHAYCTAR